jgi:hypothetical protein
MQEWFAELRTQAGNGAPQLHHATAVAAVANHLVDARGAQARMSIAEQDSGRKPANQGVRDVVPEPNKIGASTPYDFSGKNLTP